jgi:hypothetical protein
VLIASRSSTPWLLIQTHDEWMTRQGFARKRTVVYFTAHVPRAVENRRWAGRSSNPVTSRMERETSDPWVELWQKKKAIPVTDSGGPWRCETTRLPHFLIVGLQMAVRLSALCAGSASPHPHRKSPGTRFCSKLGKPRGRYSSCLSAVRF